MFEGETPVRFSLPNLPEERAVYEKHWQASRCVPGEGERETERMRAASKMRAMVCFFFSFQEDNGKWWKRRMDKPVACTGCQGLPVANDVCLCVCVYCLGVDKERSSQCPKGNLAHLQAHQADEED